MHVEPTYLDCDWYAGGFVDACNDLPSVSLAEHLSVLNKKSTDCREIGRDEGLKALT